MNTIALKKSKEEDYLLFDDNSCKFRDRMHHTSHHKKETSHLIKIRGLITIAA